MRQEVSDSHTLPLLPHQEVLDGGLALAQQGDKLTQNSSHYAEDSIQTKCSELRALSEEISCTLRAKKDRLLQALELHHSLERVGVTLTHTHTHTHMHRHTRTHTGMHTHTHTPTNPISNTELHDSS